MAAIRDINCGSDVALMDKLGRFEREFIVYGCAFRRDEQTYYLASCDPVKMYHFVNHSASEALYPTPIWERMNSSIVPAGAKQDLNHQAKVAMAVELQAAYGAEFWQIMESIKNQPASDSGLTLLEEERRQLADCFERDMLAFFLGRLQMALTQKVLIPVSYNRLREWTMRRLAQLDDDVVLKNSIERTFAGFAYRKAEQPWQIFYDGQIQTVWAKGQQLLGQGCIITPVYHKTFWFDGSVSIKAVGAEFQEALRTKLDTAILERTERLWTLPAVVSLKDLCQLLSGTVNGLNAAEKSALQQYVYCYRAAWPEILAIIGAN